MSQSHLVSAGDRELLERFLTGKLPPAELHHREHVRLAYVCVATQGTAQATHTLRSGLQAFLRQHGIDPAKYHETMTHAWVLAVHHFMSRTDPQPGADAFLTAQPSLLDPQIMLTHYSDAVLRSDRARAEFVSPDLVPIPRHAEHAR